MKRFPSFLILNNKRKSFFCETWKTETIDQKRWQIKKQQNAKNSILMQHQKVRKNNCPKLCGAYKIFVRFQQRYLQENCGANLFQLKSQGFSSVLLLKTGG